MMNRHLGVEFGKVRVIEYCKEWADEFDAESKTLRTALGESIFEIQHIGSTSIPGMPSKPIIDIMACVRGGRCSAKMVRALEKIGYHYEPDDPVSDRHFFVKPPLDIPYRTHHLSLTSPDSAFQQNNLAFRKYLIGNTAEFERYRDLKVKLANLYPDDRVQYTSAKQPYIRRILAPALKDFYGEKT